MDISFATIGKQESYKCKNNIKRIIFLIVIILCMIDFVFCNKMSVKASVWNNPIEYYNCYGNSAVFEPVDITNGNIHFCSAGNTSKSGTKYRTIGYKMSVKDEWGNTIQTIYFQLGGRYLKLQGQTQSSGKEYMLYSIALTHMKKRFNSQALEKLNSGKCTIVLDACMVVRKNGVNKGGMNDDGPTWGKVYDTYSGISGAAGWSDSALNALHSYYGKTVSGLFHAIEVKKTSGISSVSGGGVFCYGTKITINAACLGGYDFMNWNNDWTKVSSSYSFYVNSGGTYTAYAKAGSISVSFWRNTDATDQAKISKSYIYGGKNQTFPSVDWKRCGYNMIGWGNKASDSTAGYSFNSGVSDGWILANRPSKNIYAVWKENEYTIEYDTGEKVKVKYTDSIKLPEQNMCIGWILGESFPDIKYTPGQDIAVTDLCRLLGIEYNDGAVIPLYALWEHEPTIEAKDMFFSTKQAKEKKITESLIGSMISSTDVEDGVIAYGDNGKNYLIVKNFDASRIENAGDKDVIDIVLEAKDSYGNITQKTISITFTDTQIKDSTQSFGKIRFISSKYYGQNKAGGLMENSRWLKDPEFNALLRKALAI